MPRGRHIARALRQHLPGDYEQAIAILLASLGPDVPKQMGDRGMALFLYMPDVMFIRGIWARPFRTLDAGTSRIGAALYRRVQHPPVFRAAL
jgi:hypothetical protein